MDILNPITLLRVMMALYLVQVTETLIFFGFRSGTMSIGDALIVSLEAAVIFTAAVLFSEPGRKLFEENSKWAR